MFPFKSAKNITGNQETLLENISSKSRYAESYRTLRTNLHFSLIEKELSSILVTSALQDEGKTNTVANLAYTIALTGQSVLMVDADLRKSGLSTKMSAKVENGLSLLISGILREPLQKGEVAEYGLQDLIKLCWLQKRTCVMNIKDPDDEVDLFFKNGDLIDVYWKNRPHSKKLANTLLNENILTKNEATLALGHQKKSVRRLGSILLNMGFVSEKDLVKILSIHMIEAFKITTKMVNGIFSIRPMAKRDISPTFGNTIDFESLYSEFLEDDSGTSFIMKAIDASILETGHENLFLLPSGSIPPNPSELLGSAYTSYLLSLLQSKFDVVIIDTSPVMLTSDTLVLAPQTDGVILVVKAGGTNIRILQDAVHHLINVKANILGVSLNQVDRRKSEHYKSYQSYYG